MLTSDVSNKCLLFLSFSSYDFAFVDADKRMYEEYFELLLKLVRFKILVPLLGYVNGIRFCTLLVPPYILFSFFNHCLFC